MFLKFRKKKPAKVTGTTETCKFNDSRVNRKVRPKKTAFFLDWIEKRLGQVSKYVIFFRKMHKNEI